ncbi:exo-alpha-sialidase [Trypanosoma cruzi]|nr:exo-alpha-sialidase [Trypanosoma cruzi]
MQARYSSFHVSSLAASDKTATRLVVGIEKLENKMSFCDQLLRKDLIALSSSVRRESEMTRPSPLPLRRKRYRLPSECSKLLESVQFAALSMATGPTEKVRLLSVTQRQSAVALFFPEAYLL